MNILLGSWKISEEAWEENGWKPPKTLQNSEVDVNVSKCAGNLLIPHFALVGLQLNPYLK